MNQAVALGTHAPNVVGLVSFATFGLDEGELLGALPCHGPTPPALAHLFTDHQGFGCIPEDEFVKHFVADVDPVQARVIHAVLPTARTRRPMRCLPDGPYPDTKKVIGGFAVVDMLCREVGAAVGRQDRRRVPLSARGPRAHARPDRLIEGALAKTAKAFRQPRGPPPARQRAATGDR